MVDYSPPVDALYCVLYRSQAAPTFNATQDLPALTQWAQAYNVKHSVTGMLLFSSGHFVQYLEGGQAEVTALLTKIRSDKRHAKFVLLAEHVITRRHYGSWSMESFDLREPMAAATARIENLMHSHAQFKLKRELSAANSVPLASEIALQLLATFMTPPEFH